MPLHCSCRRRRPAVLLVTLPPPDDEMYRVVPSGRAGTAFFVSRTCNGPEHEDVSREWGKAAAISTHYSD